MIFCSYYTRLTPYEKVIMNCLLPSLERFDLKYDIEGVDDLGSWGANTGYKSVFIKKMLLKHKEPVVFLDSDAVINSFPKLLFEIPLDTDIAYHSFNWYGHWRNQWDKFDKMELLSGTMYFNYNEKVLGLLDTWINKVQENLNVWEQKVLEAIVYARNDLNIYNLPAEYCCVLMQDYSIPKYIKNPIIVHTQVSRKYKNRNLW